MAELKIYLSQSLNEKFRKIAMAIYGYGRGSISKAAEAALTKWCEGQQAPPQEEASDNTTSQTMNGPNLAQGINPDERLAISKSPKTDSTKDSYGSNGSS